MPKPLEARPEEFDHWLALVRQSAPDMYLANLLLPQSLKTPAFGLHAFHVEIGNVIGANHEPLAGEIRLQWWREVIEGTREKEAAGHPLADWLTRSCAQRPFWRKALSAKLEAHVFELYQDPMESRHMLEGWCGETRSVLFQLLADETLGLDDEAGPATTASGHAGCATGAIFVLQNLARSHAKGQCFVPLDLVAAAGLSVEQFLEPLGEQHVSLIKGMVDFGREHLGQAIAALGGLADETRSIYRPLALTRAYLNSMQRTPATLLNGPVELSQIARQWALWRGPR